MRREPADYTGMGQQPSGSDLRCKHHKLNFWNTVFVPLRYHLRLMLFYLTVTRLPLVSSTSTPSPQSQAHGHFTYPTLLPQFPIFYPFVSLDSTFILFPSWIVTIPPFCPEHLTSILCDALMDILISCDCLCPLLYTSSHPSSINCTLAGL